MSVLYVLMFMILVGARIVGYSIGAEAFAVLACAGIAMLLAEIEHGHSR